MPLSGKDLVKLFKKQCWLVDRIHGSHFILVNPDLYLSMPTGRLRKDWSKRY